jgi:ketosteroid isomerase-like protein
MTNAELAWAWLDAVMGRDYERVESLLADDYRLRDLSPPGFTEMSGSAAVVSRMRERLDTVDAWRLVESDVYEIGPVTYVRARVRFSHPEAGELMLEQHHLLTIADQRIRAIDQLCTGFFAP